MEKPISQLDVSVNKREEQELIRQGFTKINVDLNKGGGGKYIYLWYKRGSEPITGIQVTFNDDMAVGLINAGYKKIPKDLNAGVRGDFMYLWYFRGSGEYNTPILDIDVTASAENEALKFENDWERLGCDLNRKSDANWIYAWVKREKKTYICDVTATATYESDSDNFTNGYIRVDEDTNRGAGGSPVFIWYRQTTNPLRAIRGLNVSTNDSQHKAIQQQDYTPVNINLNDGAGGNKVYMWYKKDLDTNPIKTITLLLNKAALKVYEKAGVTVIERNLNTGNDGRVEYLGFFK